MIALRRGTATVELACCLPVLLVLVMGAMEIARALMVKQALVESAYSGARQIAGPDGTLASARSVCEERLREQNIAPLAIEFSPAAAPSVPVGTSITVTVRADCGDNAWAFRKFLVGRTIEARATAVREGG